MQHKEKDYTTEQMVNHLPDAHRKDAGSNNYKLFKIVEGSYQAISTDEQQIRLTRNIENAYGKTLDLIGENINQVRGQMSDDLYRAVLKAKMARMWCDGTFNSVVEMVAFALGCEKTEIDLREEWEETSSDSGIVSLIGVPIETLNMLAITINQFNAIIGSLLPAGVGLEVLEYTGTFQFSSKPDEIETDADAGFSDDAQTTGGYFGAVYSTDDEVNIPF